MTILVDGGGSCCLLAPKDRKVPSRYFDNLYLTVVIAYCYSRFKKMQFEHDDS